MPGEDSTSPEKALEDYYRDRAELRNRTADRIAGLDPLDQRTLQFAVVAALESHKPKELSELLGSSQSTIARWAQGQTIPRSAPFRKWAVGTLTSFLRGDGDQVEEPQRPSDMPSVATRKRNGKPALA